VERLPAGCNDFEQIELHRYRYRWASSWVATKDVVLDAACGTGYGRALLNGAAWVGVDLVAPTDPALDRPGTEVIEADLTTWEPGFPFDVFVGLETIEHLSDYSAYVRAAKMARRYIVLSTPIIPTKYFNPYHRHDFTPEQIEGLFYEWRVRAYEVQWDPVLAKPTYGLWCFSRVP